MTKKKRTSSKMMAAMRFSVAQMSETMEQLGYVKPGDTYEQFEKVVDSFDVEKFVALEDK